MKRGADESPESKPESKKLKTSSVILEAMATKESAIPPPVEESQPSPTSHPPTPPPSSGEKMIPKRGRGVEILVLRSSYEAVDEMSWHSVFIPLSDLEPHRKFDCRYYSPHDHIGGDPQRYRTALRPKSLSTHSDGSYLFSSNPALIGSTIYCLNDANQLMCLNLDAAATTSDPWKVVKTPKLIIRGRTILLASNGHLYLLGVSLPEAKDGSFGTMFDPSKDEWKLIPFPRTGGIEAVEDLVVTSFGDPAAEIFFGHSLQWFKDKKMQMVYDSEKKKWNPFEDVYFPWHIRDVVSNSVTVDGKTIFWINKHGLFCAYNSETKECNSGPIIGVENEDILEQLLRDGTCVPFFHLEGDLFCMLLDKDVTVSRGAEGEKVSTGIEDDKVSRVAELHCLVCRILDSQKPLFFILSVVGCFHCSFPSRSYSVEAVVRCLGD